jgi:gamma-glutamyltranspeptidase/glutathione hydrolase
MWYEFVMNFIEKRKMLVLWVLLCCFPLSLWAADAVVPEASSRFTEQKALVTKQVMAVTANPHATEAAISILKQGGNALDAAIAAQMVLNVVEPQSSGIGGGGFLLYYDGTSHQLYAYDGREIAPASADARMFLDNTGKPKAFDAVLPTGLAVGVPGLLAMLDLAHKAHGELPWKNLFTPAIDLAEKGFSISERLESVAQGAPHFKESATLHKGNWFTNKPLAATFRAIADKGAEVFYHGKIAEDIIAAVRHPVTGNPLMTQSDIATYEAKKVEPLCGNYQGYRICGLPPPASGTLAILQAFGIMEAVGNASLHTAMEAMRLAFADRNYYVADPAVEYVPVEGMLASHYLEKRAMLIDPAHSITKPVPGDISTAYASEPRLFPEPPSTTHLSIVDKEGNAVSMTSSIEHAFGSGIEVGGFLLNNELTDFAFVPEVDGKPVVNRIAPHKRPRSSMTPLMVFNKEGALVLVLGSPGGARIISYVYGVLRHVLDEAMPLQEAINAPHVVTTGDGVELEEGWDVEALRIMLEATGHQVTLAPQTSGIHAIAVEGGKLHAGVDPRREGVALGW